MPTTSSIVAAPVLRSLGRIAMALAVALAVIFLVLRLLLTQPVLGSFPTASFPRASPAELRRHVEFLCFETFPRNSDHPDALDEAAAYIAGEMTRHGARVERQQFRVAKALYTNVVATFGPEQGPSFVVGAHYDVFGEQPGADDNASGVAALLELARQLGARAPAVRVDLVAYTLGKPPFFGSKYMGSAQHARWMRESGRELLGMLSLEMIGYFAERQDWDSWVLELLYPSRADFVMVVGRFHDRSLVRFVKRSMRGASPIRVRAATPPRLPGMDASDHRNYWDNGFDAVMLTDTAYLRNPHYHLESDRPATLDYDKLAQVVDAVFGVTANLERLGRSAAGPP